MSSEISEEEGKPRYEFIEEDDEADNNNNNENGDNQQQLTAMKASKTSQYSPEGSGDDGEEQVVFCVSKFNNEDGSDEEDPSPAEPDTPKSENNSLTETSNKNNSNITKSPHPAQKSHDSRSSDSRPPRKSESAPNGQTKALPKVAILQRDPSERRKEDTNTTAPSSRGRKAIQVYQPPGQRNANRTEWKRKDEVESNTTPNQDDAVTSDKSKDRKKTSKSKTKKTSKRRDREDREERERREREERERKEREERERRDREERERRDREEREDRERRERIEREERERKEREERERKELEEREREREKRQAWHERELNRLERIPGGKPTLSDLYGAIFAPQSMFQIGELVLVPRSRGGFTYGKVTLCKQRQAPCAALTGIVPNVLPGNATTPASPAVKTDKIVHTVTEWRVSYPSSNKTQQWMFKDLPSSFLGKLKPYIDVIVQEKDLPNYESEVLVAADGTLTPVAVRPVGQKPTIKDLDLVVFSPQHNFGIGDTVLVPRSRGGFTYGQITGPHEASCPFTDVKHKLLAWRIIVSDDPTNRIWKDLMPVAVGKIHGAAQMSIVSEMAEIQPRPKLPFSTQSQPHHHHSSPALHQQASHLPSPQRHVSDVPHSKPEQPQSRPKIDAEPDQTAGSGGLLDVSALPNIFTPKDTKPRGQKKKKKAKGLIVIDGPNVAMKHGKNKVFSVVGIKICIEYYIKQGYDVMCFVPEHYLTRKLATGDLKLKEFLPLADNANMLQQLVNDNLVTLTPPQDYDDSYSIKYAKLHNACIVTNDRYWDHIDKQTEKEKPYIRKWIRDHCISFAFVKNEFLPNPDFVWPDSEERGD